MKTLMEKMCKKKYLCSSLNLTDRKKELQTCSLHIQATSSSSPPSMPELGPLN